MEQYPLDDSLNISSQTKSEELKKPSTELPKLNISNFKQEEKTKIQETQVITQTPKPVIRPDPIMLKPQDPPVTKGENIMHEMNRQENEQIISALSAQTSAKTKSEGKDTMINQINEFQSKNIDTPAVKNTITEKEMTFDDIDDDVEKQKRDLFFSKLKEQIDKRSEGKVSLDQKQLIENMKNYQHTILKKEEVLKEKQKIDSLLADKITTLEILEEGWYILRKEIETKQQLLIHKEKLIDYTISELKKLMEQEKIADKVIKDIPPNKWFVLKDGRKIKSVAELKETLKTIEDHTFNHHVNDAKNDFSSWIRHVFEDANLADKIIFAKTKEELIKVLEQNE